MVQRRVNGDDLLYRFFADLFDEDSALASELPARMLGTMGIWFPLDVYYDWPVLLPWVVRDPHCRGNRKKGIPDSWGSPNAKGFLTDDNSLIKALPKSLSVVTPSAGPLSGRRMGSEFVASHVWRKVRHEELASRLPLLNSFVPNLVWLPSQVSKLTDREGSVVQVTLQAMAWQIYRHAPVAPHLEGVVEEAWNLIPPPEHHMPLPTLNHFETTPRFFSTRENRLRTVVRALRRLERGQDLDEKVVTSRYTEGLPSVPEAERDALRDYLSRFSP